MIFSQKKKNAPAPRNGEQGQENPAVPPCLPEARPPHRSASTPLPCNVSPRQEILRRSVSPLPSAAHTAAPLIAPFPASGALCRCACGSLSASTVLNDWLYLSTYLCICQVFSQNLHTFSDRRRSPGKDFYLRLHLASAYDTILFKAIMNPQSRTFRA